MYIFLKEKVIKAYRGEYSSGEKYHYSRLHPFIPVRSCLILFYPIWTCLTLFGPVWPICPLLPRWAPFCYICPCLTSCGSIWPCFDPYNSIWHYILMDSPVNSIKHNLTKISPILPHWDTSTPDWIYLAPFGPVWPRLELNWTRVYILQVNKNLYNGLAQGWIFSLEKGGEAIRFC